MLSKRYVITQVLILWLLSICLLTPAFATISSDEKEQNEALINNALLTNQNRTNLPVEVIRQPSSTDELNTIVTIGTGTTGQSYPLYKYWHYSGGAAIYTPAEIGLRGTINSISLYCGTAATWSGTGQDTVDIWMSETETASFPSPLNWNQFSVGATNVYHSTVTPTLAVGWYTFTFTTPFTYSGSNNLMVLFRAFVTTDVSGGNNWYYTATTENKFIYFYTDNLSWNTIASGGITYYASLNRPNMQLDITNSATLPGAATLVSPANGTSISTATAALSWTAGANTDNFDIYLSTNQSSVVTMNSTARIASGITATTFNAPISNNQMYYWRVVARNSTTLEVTPGLIRSFNTFQQLSGMMSIGGADADFPNFASAVLALQMGGVADGGVTFNVRGGTYYESILLQNIPNVSESNQVIFQPELEAVTISTPGTSGTTDYMVKIAGTDWVTFDGISLVDTSTSSTYKIEYGYWLTDVGGTDGAQHNTIQNCSITLHPLSTTYGIRQYSTTSATTTAGTQSYNRYLNLKIGKCYYGIYIGQGSSTYRDLDNEIGSTEQGLGFTGRMVVGQDSISGTYAIYLDSQENFWVHDLDITNHNTTGITSYDIYITTAYGIPKINGNRIFNNASNSITTTRYVKYGIYVTSGTTVTEMRIYNNMIYGLKSTSTNASAIASFYIYGTYISSISTLYLDNNSYLIDAINPTNDRYNSACVYFSTATSINMRNNIFYNSAMTPTTAKHYGVYRSGGTITSSNNNVFYIPNTTNGFVGYYSADQATLGNWQTATGQDNASASTDPVYSSVTAPYNLLIGTNLSATPVENTAQQIAWITTDIEGDTRSETPDIGADEGTFVSASAPEAPTLTSPGNGLTDISDNPIILNWSIGARTTNVDVYLSTTLTDVQNSVVGARVLSATTTTSYNLSNPPEGTWYYWKVVAHNNTGLTSSSGVWSFRTYLPPLAGIKTIGGANPSFASFAAAIAGMQLAGVGAGGVTFNIRPGTYYEAITIPNTIANVSEENQVVFQKETGTVTISTPGTSATTDYMIKLAGADWITFDGISLVDTSSGTNNVEYGIWVTDAGVLDGAQHNTFKNCSITLRAQSTTYGIRQYYTSTPSGLAGAQSYNKYLNLKIGKCYYGMYFYQTSSTYRDFETDIGSTVAGTNNPDRMVIGQDSIIGTYAVYMYNQENLTIHDLDITNHNANLASYDLYISTQGGSPKVYGNRIYNNTSYSTSTTRYAKYGMYISAGTALTDLRIYNNMIYGLKSTSANAGSIASFYIYGTYVSSVSTLNLDNNSYLIDATNPNNDLYNSACVYLSSGTSINMRNNIFYNASSTPTTAKHYGVYRSSSTITSSDNNVFYIPDNANGYVGYYTSDCAELTDWQNNTSMDQASSFGDPQFASIGSPAELHIADNMLTPVSNAGQSIAWVTTDLDGESRSATPDIGADEGIFGINDPSAPTDGNISDITFNSMRFNWTDIATDETGYRVMRSTDGINYTLLANLDVNANTYLDEGLPVTTHYWYRVYELHGLVVGPGYTSANGITGHAAAMANPTANPAIVSSGVPVTFTIDLTSTQAVTIDSVKISTNGSALAMMSYASGSLPGTATYTYSNSFTTMGTITYFCQAYYSLGIAATPLRYPTIGTVSGPLVVPAQTSGPDGSNYYYRTSLAVGGPVFAWRDIAATGTLLTGMSTYDDNGGAISLGTFTFPFYGSTVSGSIFASTNGNIQIGSTGSTSLTNAALPNSTLNAGAICLLWDDLKYGNTTPPPTYGTDFWIKSQNFSDSLFVVSYYAYRYNVPADTIAMQALIYNTGRIVVQYRTYIPSTTVLSATIGIQGATAGTNFLQYGSATTMTWPGNNFAIEYYRGVPNIAVSTSSINFGSSQANIAASQTVYVRSTGSLPLVVTNVTVPENVVPSWTSNTINAGDSLALLLTWTPIVEGSLSGNVVITSNAASSPTSIAVSGSSYILPGSPTVVIAYDVDNHNATITWVRPTGSITGYVVYRNLTGYFDPPTVGTLIATISDPMTTTYQDLGVTGSYYYRVKAYYSTESSSSIRSVDLPTTVKITPAKPVNQYRK